MAASKLRIYQDVARHLADARFDLITDDVETRYALDDAWAEAVDFVLRQAAWRFALKTGALGGTTGPVPGFASAYTRPSDWLRTHAIFQVGAAGRECPLDIKEQGVKISANPIASGAIVMRYVSADYADPAFSPWPEHFAQLVAAYLAFLVAVRVTGERSATGRMSELFSSLLPAALAMDAVPEDPWLPHQRDGTFARVSETLARGFPWRFATASTEITTTAAAGLPGGFLRQAAKPQAWWRTLSLYVLTAGDQQRRPLDVREQAELWYTNETSFWVEYLSYALARNSANWPMQFMQAVLLALQVESGAKTTDADTALAQAALAAAVAAEAEPPDPWLPYQLDGSFRRAMQAVIVRGYWNDFLKTVQIDLSQQLTDPAMSGYPYRFAMPDDWLITHALFIPRDGEEAPFNIRESAEDWSTDAPLFTARYLSTDALDPVNSPEPVMKAVLAYLEWQGEPAAPAGDRSAPVREPAYEKLLADAIRLYALPESRWLRHQLAGTYQPAVKQVLEKGRWRFAIRTIDLQPSTDPTALSDGTVSTGYAYRFLKPNDWLRTIWVHFQWSSGLYGVRQDLDFRDEEDAIHANRSPITLRYLTRVGLDATRWPANFGDAVLALLEHLEMRTDPTKAAAAKAKLEFYERQCALAETLDDTGEVPRINSTGRFVAARYGWRGHGGPQNGWSSDTILTG